MKNGKLLPLHPGDVALRFRIEWAGRRDGRAGCRVFGLEAVEVVAVKGAFVTWTNHKRCAAWTEGKFRHTSHRGELIAVAALEQLSDIAEEAESGATRAPGPAAMSV